MVLARWIGIAVAVSACAAIADELQPIDEIVVVSTRIEQSVKDVPAAVTVIGKRDIQLGRQQLGLDESLNRVPGLFAQNRYNFAQDLRIAIRGFGARANFGIRGLKIYADGIPATTADGQSGIDDIDLGSLTRIEVTRGPTSSLYGASAGGVISLFSEDGPDEPTIQTGVTLGEDQQRKYQLKAGGQTERLNYMVSVSDLSYDGFRDNSRVESTQLNSKFRFDIDDDSELMIALNLVDSPVADDAGGITSAQAAADPSQAQPRNLSSNAGEKLDQQKLGLVYTRQLQSGAEMVLRNYYVQRDFSAFLPIGSHIPFVSDDGVVEFERFFYGGGLQFSVTRELFGFPHRITTGLDIDIQSDDRQRYLNDAGVKGALSFDQLEEAESYGVFVRDEISLSSDVRLIVGAHYNKVELSVDDRFLSNADQSSRIDFDELSPLLAAVWDLTPKVSAYGSYSTSFETPTFTELASPARNLTVSLGGFNNVSAQDARSHELGLKGGFLEDRLYFDIAVFTMEVKDEITNVANIGDRSFFENADTDRSGLEISAVATPGDNWRLSVAYTYSDFTFDHFATDPAYEGNNLPGLPEHQLFAEVAYSHPSGFYVVGDVLVVGELYANNANSTNNDKSTVANARAGYSTIRGRWTVAASIGVNNLFDESYNSNVRINGFGGRLFEPAPPRNLYMGIIVDYQLR